MFIGADALGRPSRGSGPVGFMAVAMFVGFNLYHADTLRDEKAGLNSQPGLFRPKVMSPC